MEYLGLLVPLFALSIPIVAIMGNYFLQIQKLKHSQGFNDKDKKLLETTLEANTDIKTRLENLEAIITSMDKEILALHASDNAKLNQKKVEDLAKELKSGNEE